MRRLIAFLAGWAVLGSAAVHAQAWVDTVFPKRSHDFGTVARGSKVSHAFKVINTTDKEIHITTWRTKCGCTEVKVGSQDIPPGTQTTIEAVIDTTKFQGYKASGLTLVLDRPVFQEVDLNLTCFIRGDLTVTPGQVDFGSVPRSSKPTVALNLSYAGGQPDWAVTKMQTLSPHVSAKLQEVGRSAGQVQYVLSATLNASAPTGFFKDEITLATNDPSGPSIPISVSANLQAGVTVAPTIINLGRVKPGEVVTKTLQVRSAQKFKVTSLRPSKDDLTAKPPGDGSNEFHPVVLTFKAPTKPGPYNAALEIETDLKDEGPVKVTTFANIVP